MIDSRVIILSFRCLALLCSSWSVGCDYHLRLRCCLSSDGMRELHYGRGCASTLALPSTLPVQRVSPPSLTRYQDLSLSSLGTWDGQWVVLCGAGGKNNDVALLTTAAPESLGKPRLPADKPPPLSPLITQ